LTRRVNFRLMAEADRREDDRQPAEDQPERSAGHLSERIAGALKTTRPCAEEPLNRSGALDAL
jgi:hypothetical protein